MPKFRNTLGRRVFAQPEHLEEMRWDLAQYNFTLTLGTGGYWYAQSEDGLECYSDRDPTRTYALALAAIYARVDDKLSPEGIAQINSEVDAAIARFRKGGK